MTKNITFFCLAAFVSVNLWGQTESVTDSSSTKTTLESSEVYEIDDIKVDVYGLTRSWALLNKLDLYKGQAVTGAKNWENFIENKRKQLASLRFFDSSELTTEIKAGEKGKKLVTISIRVKDAWNILTLPYPKYNSNSGFLLSIKVRDNNFCGTLERLSLDLDYAIKEDDTKEFKISNSQLFPFFIAATEWDLELSNAITFREQLPLRYDLNVGFAYKFRFSDWRWRTFFKQGLVINEGNDSNVISEFYFNRSTLGISTFLPLGLRVGSFGVMEYSASLSGGATYKWGAPLDDSKKDYLVNFYHKIGFGQLFWDSNFREGLKIHLSHAVNFNFKDNTFRCNVELHQVGATRWNWGGFSQRALIFYEMFSTRDKAGSSLRGILDKRIQADFGLTLNLDFHFRIFHFQPSQWLNRPCYRLFDFELHFIPFFDVGWFGRRPQEVNVLPWIGTGLEVLIYPQSLRSLYIRISYGVDFFDLLELRRIAGTSLRDGWNIRELSITIGSLFY